MPNSNLKHLTQLIQLRLMIHNDMLIALDNAFTRCGSPNNPERQAGENDLKNLKATREYPLALVNYIQAAKTPEKGLRAAIELKLWMAGYKGLELFEIEQYLQVVEMIKPPIVDLYLSTSNQIADQLGEAIVNMAAVEFPDRWANLMKLLVAKVSQNAGNTQRILLLMTMITYRYTYSMRSDPLYREIILVCDDTHDFLLRVTQSVLECILTNHPDLDNFYGILRSSMRLFYNLNYQDLHPSFQDNLRKWMDILIKVMRLPGHNLKLLKAKCETLKCILLYASKYKEDIEPIIQEFSQEIWKLCSSTKGEDEISDKIQLIAIKYFKHLVVWQDMKPFFAQHLETLLQTLIFPSIGLTKSTVAMFEDQPTLFIENYFENSQINTRRSTAVELLKSITRSYNFSELLKKQLLEFVQINQAQGRNIPAECLILNLVVDSGTVAFRSVDGVTQIAISEQIIKYVYLQIVKPFFASVYQWVSTNPNKPIQSCFNLLHLSTHMRFVFFYRLYIPKQDLQVIIKFCCCLHTNSQALRSIICMLLQAIIDIRFGDYMFYNNLVPYFDEEKLDAVAFEILKMVFNNEQQEKELNKYLTKTLYILAKKLNTKCVKYVEHFMAVITSMLKKTESYDFKSVLFVFEAWSMLVYNMLAQGVDIKGVEATLEAYFNKILRQGSDLLNFAFQIFSLIVQMKAQLPASYTTMYLSVLTPNNWAATNSSLFSAYVQYITSYLKKHPGRILSDKPQLQVVLSKLIELKDFKHFSSLLNGILEVTELDGFYNSGYLAIMIHGTTAALSEPQPKPAILKSAILLFCTIIVEYDAKKAIELTNQISPLYVENLMTQGLSIISMIQLRDERRMVFQGISTLIGMNLLSSVQKLALMLNALVENTNRRFIGRTTTLNEPQDADSAYQKLSVFKQLPTKPSNLTKDEQKFLVESFKAIYSQGHLNIAQLIPQKSQQQLTRLINKYQQG